MSFPVAQAPPAEGRIIVEWKAGKCSPQGTTITPDSRKGMFRLSQSDDGLMHMQWHDRSGEQLKMEDDLIVVNDAYMEKLDYITDARCHVVKFTSSDKLYFIWNQHMTAEDDQKNMDLFNTSIGAEPPSKDTEMADATLAAAAPAPTTGTTASDPNLDATLANLLSTLGQQGGAAGTGAAGNEQQVAVALQNIITGADLSTLMNDEEAKKELMEFLPEQSAKNDDELRETFTSPQLKSCLSQLNHVIYSGQVANLFGMLQLDQSFLQSEKHPMVALLKALEKKNGQK